jgi:hypothetical protein
MRNVKGHIVGLYNAIIDYKKETKIIFSNFLNVNINDININLRYTDLSIQIIINSDKILEKQKTKIIFVIDRLNEYETFNSISDVNFLLINLIKIKDRRKKINKITNKIN